MKIEKKNLNEALKVLGKVVSQTSPVEVQKSIRFVGDANGITAMATDGIEVISLVIEATTEYVNVTANKKGGWNASFKKLLCNFRFLLCKIRKEPYIHKFISKIENIN